jgi:polyisoprenyl-teichoic acid--peptidoglycan teichoic acid transferase
MNFAVRLWVKATIIALALAMGLLLITALILAGIGWYKFSKVAKAGELSPSALLSQIKTGWQTIPKSHQGSTTFLILGTDQLETRGDIPPLTDTMLLVNLNYKTGRVNLLPLPRDLWSDAYQTRINALYSYGPEHNPDHPEQFVVTALHELAGLNIDYPVVITMLQLEAIIDVIDGIQVDVPVGFIDNEFPRADVDVTKVFDPKLLYETVEFSAGQQTMNGATALKYVRSRHSESDQGTDNDRSARQQLIFSAIITKLSNVDTLSNTQAISGLFKVYKNNFEQYLPLPDLVAMGKKILPVRKQIEIKHHSLSIYPESSSGVIYHPPEYLFQNQWVYTVKDADAFTLEINKLLTK